MVKKIICILCIFFLCFIPAKKVFAISSQTESYIASESVESEEATNEAQPPSQTADYHGKDGVITALICVSIVALGGEFLFTLKRLLK